MTLDGAVRSALEAAMDGGGDRVSANAFVIGARTLLANGGLSQAWHDIEQHDWAALVDVGITQGAKIIAAIDPGLAPIAPFASAIIIFARHHPAGTLSRAMMAADGHGGGEPGTDHSPI